MRTPNIDELYLVSSVILLLLEDLEFFCLSFDLLALRLFLVDVVVVVAVVGDVVGEVVEVVEVVSERSGVGEVLGVRGLRRCSRLSIFL